jgi:hypothetical protein
MLNPFRREADAFKILVAVLVGAAIVALVTVVTGRSAIGLAVAVALVCLAAVKLGLDYGRWRDERDREAGEGPAA